MTNQIFASHTLSVSIERPSKHVYRFASNLANLPRWATTFCKSAKRAKGKWLVETSLGPMGIQLEKKNALGVLDHFVIPPVGVAVYVPMRVVANGAGSEVIFTLFRTPDMSIKRFAEDIALVKRDLRTLKNVLERESE
jgi:hypothetical protein